MTEPDSASSQRPRRLLLVANPISGAGRGRRWLDRAARWLRAQGVEVVEVVTDRRGDAEAAGRQDLTGFDGVWAFGGDGTINEVAQGLTDGDVPLSILPTGTGNVVARELGIPRRFGPAFRAAYHGAVRRLDVGEADGRFFLFMLSGGFDAAVVHDIAARRRSSMSLLDYVPAVRACRRRAERPFRVLVEGQARAPVHWAAVFNVSRYAGPFRACPEARIDDGALHLMSLREPVGPRLYRVAWHLLRGRWKEIHDCEVTAVRSVQFEDVPFLQIDGDPDHASRVDVRLRPAALWCRGKA